MALSVGDILELKILGAVLGQRIMTVLHYRLDSYTALGTEFSDTSDILAEIVAGTAGSDPLASLLSCQSLSYIRDSVTLQKVSPTRSIYLKELSSANGLLADDCTVPNIAIVLTKRGSAGGRRGIGGIHIGGLANTAYTAGEVDIAFLATLSAALPGLQGVLTTTGPTATLTPCIFNPGATPNFQYVVELLIQRTIRTMHRRTVGLGI